MGDEARGEPTKLQLFFTPASDTGSVSGNARLVCWPALRKCPPPPPAQQVHAFIHCIGISTVAGHIVVSTVLLQPKRLQNETRGGGYVGSDNTRYVLFCS